MKLVGKLQDGTVFLKKGHGDGEDLFEFKTDEGTKTVESLYIAGLLCILFLC